MQPLLEDGELVGAGTSYGLLTRDDGRYLWTPIVDVSSRDVRGWARPSGTNGVLMATTSGVFITQDQGCAWSPVDGELGSAPVADLALGEGRSSTVFAATERADGANAVWRSTDGGMTWTRTALGGDEVLYSRVVAKDGIVAVEGFQRDASTWAVWFSQDDGASWDMVSEDLRLLGVDGTNLLVAEEDGADWSVRRFDGDTLGDPLAVLDERPRSAGYAGDELRMWDGEAVVDADGTVRRLSAHCLLSDVDAAAVWLCVSTVEELGGHFLRIGPDEDQALVDFRDVWPRECPDGSAASEAILEEWPILKSQGVGPADSTTLGDDVQDGCGCGTTGGAAPAWILVVLIGLRSSISLRGFSGSDTFEGR